MQTVQGKTVDDKLLSIDSILTSMLRKQQLMASKINRKNARSSTIHISEYKEQCDSGDIVCTHLSLIKIGLKRTVVVIDKYPKKVDLFLITTIRDDEGKESTTKVNLKQGINSIKDERVMKPGDRLSVRIEYPKDSPEGIWVAIRGEQV